MVNARSGHVRRAMCFWCLGTAYLTLSSRADAFGGTFAFNPTPRSTALDGTLRQHFCRSRRASSIRSAESYQKPNPTPLWTLKVTQLLLFSANVCLVRFITVYYHELGFSRKLMGLLQFLMPMMSFVGGLFWSVIVDRTGSYRGTLTSTSLLGVVAVFGYLLPQIGHNLPLLLVITLLHGFLTAPSGPIVDGLCLKVLSEQTAAKKEDYGDQRLWSAIGFGSMALVAGKLVDIYGTKCIFFCYAVLVGLNILVVQLFIYDSPSSNQKGAPPQVSFTQWLKTLLKFEPLWMLINLLIYGMLIALIENFLNVFIVQDFKNAPNVIVGAATAVMCVFEIPVFKYIDNLWTKRGYSLVTVLWFAELVMALRCFLYAILPRHQPWLVLFVEPLHGFTFAAVWCATVTYANRLALPGTEAKMQALINGLYFNVAAALGSYFWGCASQKPPAGLGFTNCFILDGVFTIAWLLIWAVGYAMKSRMRKSRTYP
ncbi:unnamed protein product [Durusdinium trenchii]|uniref:Major facilitator superfamily domain-containing protein 6 (Macrophage MHC class I receptor 2) n=2 Tax=Durusdinium trenchii TaxID=1381693 RepID=A0ABP0J3C1_9DINO